MDVLGSTGQVELNLFRTQLDEERQIRALASGLRVISASDDPSGLAISENIQTQVLGLQQGVQNVQTAGNLLDVADSTLANVQQILQRVHGLIVQASSDLNSQSDLEKIQSEIDTLLVEINKISSSANFNGITLFNGSLANYVSSGGSSVEEVTSPALPDGSQSTGTQVVNWDGVSGTPGNLVSSDINPGTSTLPRLDTTNAISSYITIRVTGYSSNAIDPDTNTAVGPGDYVQIVAYSTDPKMGAAPEYMDTQAVPIGMGDIPGITIQTPSGMNNLLDITLANLTAADVGTSMSFLTTAESSSTSSSGTPLTVNSSGQEGGDVRIALPNVSTSALNVSGISVLQTNVEGATGQIIGTASNQAAASDAQLRVQAALDTISTVRAQVGAQSVALQEDAGDASVQIVNQTASESAIRDVNVGQTVTQFTKDQVMTQIGTSVLAQMHANAQLVIQLVNGLNPGTQGRV